MKPPPGWLWPRKRMNTATSSASGKRMRVSVAMIAGWASASHGRPAASRLGAPSDSPCSIATMPSPASASTVISPSVS